MGIIKLGKPFSLKHTVLSHGWVNLDPWEWDKERNMLFRPELIVSRYKIRIQVSQIEPDKLMVIYRPLMDSSLINDQVINLVRRWLSLDWNPDQAVYIAEGLSPEIASFIKRGGGRFLHGSTFYEDFVKTITTMNASWAFTKKIVSRIVKHIGCGTFPTPRNILDVGQGFLESEIRLGYRAKILIESTMKLLEGGLINENGEELKEKITYDKLIAFRGIGPYAAGHLMVLLQDFSKIPIDSDVIKYCNGTYGIQPNEISQFFSEWGDYTFLGYKLNRIILQKNWIG